MSFNIKSVYLWLIRFLLQLFFIGLLGFLILHSYFGVFHLITSKLKIWQIIVISLQLIFESIIFIQLSLIILGISSIVNSDGKTEETIEISNFPDIDVYIPIRRVNSIILEKTINAIRNDDYPQDKVHIFIADDTPESNLVKKYKTISKKFDVNYIHDPSNIRYKAGMLNIALKYGKSPFIAFFDYDQIPQFGILKHFIGNLLKDESISFIQAKKTFRNLSNLAKIWSALLYLQYFEVFQRIKNKTKTVLFAGSTACFRRNAIDNVGGIPEDTFTEDNGLAVLLMLDGQYGKFSNFIGSVGNVPHDFSEQISQLWRWSHGASHVLRNNFFKILKSKNLKLNQKIDLIATFSIAPNIVVMYLYSITFIPLIYSNVDTVRLSIFGISSLALVPILTATSYIIIAITAVGLSKHDELSEFKFRHLPGFLLIALSSNLLVFSSGLTGILGKVGPDSKRGEWNRKIHIFHISALGFISGLILEYYAIIWLINGFTSAILLIFIGITLLPGLPIAIYYRTTKMKNTSL